MSALPVGSPPLGSQTIIHPDPNACSACKPSYEHERKWISNPKDGPGRPRTLVLCFDGTGDSFDQDNSNVIQFLAMLKKDDPTKQLVYYQAGIGTYTGNGVVGTPIIQSMSKLLDSMIAWNLPEHIKDGYAFLMQSYRVGDHICIFGFSRGAFTARALAGMLQKVGLLPPCNAEQLPFAYSMYARDDRAGLELSMLFKRTFSIDVKIQFLGVWDTVQSVGLIPKHLPFSGANNAVVNFRHALALDERRVKFMPFFCTTPGKVKDGLETLDSTISNQTEDLRQRKTATGRGRSESSLDFETGVNALTGPDTDVEEVFFAGAHCDVGGGSVANDVHHSLARIPLRWMIRECFKLKSGIIFDGCMLKHEVGFDVDSPDSLVKAPSPLAPESHHLDWPGDTGLKGFTLSRVPLAILSGIATPFAWVGKKLSKLRYHKPPETRYKFTTAVSKFQYEGSEAREELKDALSPIFDQLDMHWYWKVMEWLPWIAKKQSAELADSDDPSWAYKFLWNRGRGRRTYNLVIRRGMKVHRSVKLRMLAQGRKGEGKPYVPRVRFFIDGQIRRLTREEWLADQPKHFEWVDWNDET